MLPAHVRPENQKSESPLSFGSGSQNRYSKPVFGLFPEQSYRLSSGISLTNIAKLVRSASSITHDKCMSG